MFSPQGPGLRELAVQAMSSTERGYDLLAPKFDHTPFRTPDHVVAAVGEELRPLGPFRAGLDVCCGTGAGTALLARHCAERAVGVDFSAGMLAVARENFDRDGSASARGRGREETGTPVPRWVRADALALPFVGAFDLAVSFGAFGHFRPAERPALFGGVYRSLRPGGLFAFPVPAPPSVGSAAYWTLCAFDGVMRLRNLLRRPEFVMYYRTFRLPEVIRDLERAGFRTELAPLTRLGTLPGGAPRARLVLARRPS
ncbi:MULTISPECIES: class I SAM-dependent methyltransferase [unclassified Streptomyces]|uniref:class I SAM-dependent methyltransferase n=1 Tax=unclassified Streptomyces TaxID=2593676 RepID=UPI000CD5C557|nr:MULTISPECIES: class I SAM-dependent methyltransferase [unclassified Streptomyces]